MPSSLSIALVGYGRWGLNYARVIGELRGTELGAIFDIDPGRLDRARTRHSQVRCSSDVQDILADTSLDAVVIATPASTHYELARVFLESDRHVLMEKPMALRVDHCENLREIAEHKQKVLMVGHTFLYNSGIHKMKEVIASPDFGRVYYLHATRTNMGPIRHDVNAVWDLAAHDVSIFNYLLDQQPRTVSAVGSKVLHDPREDVAFITLQYGSGVIANIHVSWADPNKVREVVAVGSRRRVVFDDLNSLERIRIFEKGVSAEDPRPETYGEFKLVMRDGDILSPKIEPSEPLKDQCEDFISAIQHRRRPISDGHVGVQVVRSLVAIEESLREGGVPKEV